MSDLIIAVYRSPPPAFHAGESLARLQQAAGTEPEDIVVVTRDTSGRVTINQSISLATGEPQAGGRWGALLGLMFLDQRKQQETGNGIGAQFRAAGLDDRFLQDVARGLQNDGAAVAMRVRLLGKDRVIDALQGLNGSPKILWTRLSPEAEAALVDMQMQIPETVPGNPAAIGEP